LSGHLLCTCRNNRTAINHGSNFIPYRIRKIQKNRRNKGSHRLRSRREIHSPKFRPKLRPGINPTQETPPSMKRRQNPQQSRIHLIQSTTRTRTQRENLSRDPTHIRNSKTKDHIRPTLAYEIQPRHQLVDRRNQMAGQPEETEQSRN